MYCKNEMTIGRLQLFPVLEHPHWKPLVFCLMGTKSKPAKRVVHVYAAKAFARAYVIGVHAAYFALEIYLFPKSFLTNRVPVTMAIALRCASQRGIAENPQSAVTVSFSAET